MLRIDPQMDEEYRIIKRIDQCAEKRITVMGTLNGKQIFKTDTRENDCDTDQEQVEVARVKLKYEVLKTTRDYLRMRSKIKKPDSDKN